LLLNTRTGDPDLVAQGRELADRALGAYGVLARSDWRQGPAYRHLPAREQGQLQEEVGEVLLLLARARALEASPARGARRTERLREAEARARRAESCSPQEPPPAVWEQRAELAEALGNLAEAGQLRAEARAAREARRRAGTLSARDHYLEGAA